jgi:centractin
MFEIFNVPKLYIAQSPIVALYSHCVTTGVVLDIGDGVTSAISIDEGKSIFNSIKRNDFGGRDLTISLSDTLKSPVGLETIR